MWYREDGLQESSRRNPGRISMLVELLLQETRKVVPRSGVNRSSHENRLCRDLFDVVYVCHEFLKVSCQCSQNKREVRTVHHHQGKMFSSYFEFLFLARV